MSNPFWNDLESNVKKAKKSAQDSAEKAKKHKERGDRAVRWWLDCEENNKFFRMKTVHIGIIVLSIVSIVFFITRKNCLINEQCISSDESKETCGSNKCFRNEDLIIFWTIYGLALLLFIMVFITQFIYDMKKLSKKKFDFSSAITLPVIGPNIDDNVNIDVESDFIKLEFVYKKYSEQYKYLI